MKLSSAWSVTGARGCWGARKACELHAQSSSAPRRRRCAGILLLPLRVASCTAPIVTAACSLGCTALTATSAALRLRAGGALWTPSSPRYGSRRSEMRPRRWLDTWFVLRAARWAAAAEG